MVGHSEAIQFDGLSATLPCVQPLGTRIGKRAERAFYCQVAEQCGCQMLADSEEHIPSGLDRVRVGLYTLAIRARRLYFANNLFLYSGGGKPFVVRHMAAPDFTTRRALRGLTGVRPQGSAAVIFRVLAESPERILVLTNPDVCLARLSMQHSGVCNSATFQP
jgi:hypothetical protein